MRKTVIRALVGLCLSLVFASAKSTGIPVVDIGAIMNMVMQYQQMLQQYETLKNQLTTQAKQLESMTGARGMGALLSNPAIQSALPPDWANAYSKIQSSPLFKLARKKFPVSNNPQVNAIFDQAAATNATMQDFFNKTQLRITQIQQLQGQIDSASDPAAKADLQNRMVSEQNSIAASSQLLATMGKLAEQDADAARQSAHRSLLCSEFKNCPTN